MLRIASRTLKSLAKGSRRLMQDNRGATAVEYGLIIALIVLVMVASLSSVADITTEMWNGISHRVTSAR